MVNSAGVKQMPTRLSHAGFLPGNEIARLVLGGSAWLLRPGAVAVEFVGYISCVFKQNPKFSLQLLAPLKEKGAAVLQKEAHSGFIEHTTEKSFSSIA